MLLSRRICCTLRRGIGSRALLHILLSGLARLGESGSGSCAVVESNVGLSGYDPLVDQLHSLSALPHDVCAVVVSGAPDALRRRGHLANVGRVQKAADA